MDWMPNRKGPRAVSQYYSTLSEREQARCNARKYSRGWAQDVLLCNDCRELVTEMRRDLAYLRERVDVLEPENLALRERVRVLSDRRGCGVRNVG